MSELYIWGELDKLPSIDAESITTLAWLIHFGDLDRFQISTHFDPSESPNGDFPLLLLNESTYAGFSAIHVQVAPQNTRLSSAQDADIKAWSLFIQEKGRTLLDLYLYVSSSNYWETISPAFTKILPWYSNYIIPPARRKAAIARTSHLGIRSLDLDSIDDLAAGDDIKTDSKLTRPKTPEELLKKQKSEKWLQNQQHSDTFQLYQLTTSFFEPLEELLGEKEFLLSEDQPTSLDCVAVGYLTLMLYASVPQPWLADAIKSRYPKLQAYVKRMYSDTFEDSTRPWRFQISRTPAPDAIHAVMIIGNGLLHFVLPATTKLVTTTSSSTTQDTSSLSTIITPSLLLPVAALAGLALGVSKYISLTSERGQNTFTAQEHDYLSPSKLSDLGEAGSIFSSAFGPQLSREQERTGGATVVEIDVENEQGEIGRDILVQN